MSHALDYSTLLATAEYGVLVARVKFAIQYIQILNTTPIAILRAEEWNR
jgi:hypothetical protein